MGKLTVKFHPLFIVFAFILVYFGWVNQFFVYMLTLCIHEYAHYFVAKKCGYKLNKVVFMPYGAGLGGNSQIINPKHEILIALAGPIINLICVILCVAFWWLFPETYSYTETFVFSSLALGTFNLIPVFPLDGGRVAICYFIKKMDKLKVYKIMKFVGFLFSLIFLGLFIASVFYAINLTYMFTSVFLFFSCFGTDENVYFERTFVSSKTKQIETPIELKSYVVNKGVPLYKLVKYIGGGHYTQFYVLDDNNKVIKVLNESDVIKFLNNQK